MKKILSTLALLLAIGQGAWAQDQWKSINDGKVVVGTGQHFYISGTGETTSNQISIKSGGTVTLSNVKISNVDYCLQCDGNATIILEDGTENTLTSTGDYSHDRNYGNHPALRVGHSGSTLTIKGGTLGTGILNANGSANHAAIGGGTYYSAHTCGNIRIEGGVINARGGEWAAAIGSDRYRNDRSTCGDITITGGTITAWGGLNAAAIGSGCDGGCGKVTITNGVAKVLAIKGANAPYSIGIGKSADYTSTCGTVTTNCTLDGSTPVGGQTGFIANNYAFVTTSEQLTEAAGHDNTDIVLGADISIGSLLKIEKTTTLDLNGHTLTRTGAEGDKNNGQVVWVTSSGNLTIKDTGTGGTITGGYAYSGGGIWNDGTLTIEGGIISGNTVVDKSGVDGRGGGIFNKSGATLTITGGTITGNEAVGSAHGGAGIFNDGTLTMTGGSVTSNRSVNNGGGIKNYGTLNMEGAPVVSGNTGDDVWLGEGKVITCTGAFTGAAESIGIAMERVGTFTSGYGTTGTATNPFFASKDVNDIAIIDNECRLRIGYYECSWDATNKQVVHTLQHADNVTYLTGGENANIGVTGSDSWYFVEDNINYSMRVWCYGDVHLILGDNAQMMIGHGLKVFGEGTTQNASLKIYSQSYGDAMGRLISHCDASDEAGIGSVASTKMGPVEFHGGYIEAEGDDDAAGIGGGEDANSDAITIYDGIIKATSGKNAAAIGGGYGGSAESITIYGGDVTADANVSKFDCGAGIGGGIYLSGGGSCGVINIWGGTVTAKAGSGAAGIGSGYITGNVGGEINIHGGTVYAYAFKGGAGIGSGMGYLSPKYTGGTIRISGGDVKAYGQEGGVGIGSYYGECDIEISGGTVYAEGSNGYIGYPYYGVGIGGIKDKSTNGGTVTITGGDVTAVCPNGAINYAGTVTIGTEIQVRAGDDETNATLQLAANRVTACKDNKYAHIVPCSHSEAAFTIDDGFYHHSNGCDYCLLSSGESQAHAFVGDANQCICGLHELKDNADNTTMIQALATSGEAVPVALTGRTLNKDGSWNTLCLPFGLDDFTGTPLEGAIVKTLENATFSNGTLTLNFSENSLTAIEAGKPYIVKWAATTPDYMENPVFNNVTISNTSTSEKAVVADIVTFKGEYAPLNIGEEGDETILYLGTDNTFRYPKGAMDINAFRAYIHANTSLGDVNGDGKVNVTDVTMLVDNILGKSNDNFIMANADVTRDGDITVTDVTALVNLILGGNSIVKMVVNGADGITFGGGGNEPARVAGTTYQDD